MAEAAAAPLSVCVAFSPGARRVVEMELRLPLGSTAMDALQAAGLGDRVAELEQYPQRLAVWGRTAALAQTLRDRDRVEIHRALLVDPKLARRQRFVQQGARAAGLFAKRRDNAKAGY